MIDYQEIKHRVSTEQAAIKYGYDPDSRHRILCPFHDDHKPSLMLYPGDRGWYCFVCGIGGDVVGFVSKLFHLSPHEAAKKLNDDFCLGMTDGPAPSRMYVQKARHDQAMQRAKKMQGDAKELEMMHRYFALRSLPPPTGVPHDSPLWGQYAAFLGELDYFDNCYFAGR